MLKVNREIVNGYNQLNVPYTMLTKEQNAKKLAIILPGAGYTVQAPLLHYSTGVFINKGFDVLQVNYQYNSSAYDEFSMEEISEAIKYDVRKVVDHALNDKSYDNIYIIGKSLGTIAMSSELSRDIFSEAKAVWFTPLLQRDDVFHAMMTSKHKGLCFIGDNDRCYIEERYNQLKRNVNITSTLIPNVSHSLEYDDHAIKSIDVLKSVINDIDQF